MINEYSAIAKLYNVNLTPPPLDVQKIHENDIIHIGATSWLIKLLGSKVFMCTKT